MWISVLTLNAFPIISPRILISYVINIERRRAVALRPQTFLMTNDGSSRPARLHADTISRLFIPWADSHPHLNYQEEDKRKDERRKELGETRGGSIQHTSKGCGASRTLGQLLDRPPWCVHYGSTASLRLPSLPWAPFDMRLPRIYQAFPATSKDLTMVFPLKP